MVTIVVVAEISTTKTSTPPRGICGPGRNQKEKRDEEDGKPHLGRDLRRTRTLRRPSGPEGSPRRRRLGRRSGGPIGSHQLRPHSPRRDRLCVGLRRRRPWARRRQRGGRRLLVDPRRRGRLLPSPLPRRPGGHESQASAPHGRERLDLATTRRFLVIARAATTADGLRELIDALRFPNVVPRDTNVRITNADTDRQWNKFLRLLNDRPEKIP